MLPRLLLSRRRARKRCTPKRATIACPARRGFRISPSATSRTSPTGLQGPVGLQAVGGAELSDGAEVAIVWSAARVRPGGLAVDAAVVVPVTAVAAVPAASTAGVGGGVR